MREGSGSGTTLSALVSVREGYVHRATELETINAKSLSFLKHISIKGLHGELFLSIDTSSLYIMSCDLYVFFFRSYRN